MSPVHDLRGFAYHMYVAHVIEGLCHISCTLLSPVGARDFPNCNPEPLRINGSCGGGTNPCDMGLDLSGSWQQGHSATYNAPSRI